MPTYKHPCPQCETFIDGTADACPACGFADPFAPDAAARVVRRPAPTTPAAPTPAPVAPSPARACTGCGASLAPGARFCTECGTLVGQ